MAERKAFKLLGKILEEKKILTHAQIEEALKRQVSQPGKRLGEILVEMGWANPSQITEALAEQYNVPFINLLDMEIPSEVLNIIPSKVAREYKIIPIKRDKNILTIAMSDPLDIFTLDNLKFMLNCDVEYVLATPSDIKDVIEKYYGRVEKEELKGLAEVATQTETDIKVRRIELDESHQEVDDAPIIKYINFLITEAVKLRASDIHIEPFETYLRIRYRIDGLCQEAQRPPTRLQSSIISRVKLMADMDIAEKRKPQDGAIRVKAADRELDIRVSSIPGVYGESIVMRILDKKSGLKDLEELGFDADDYKRFKSIIRRPNGMFLVTGPTGSGKTTTLYAALKELNRPDVKIITAENPVEYDIAGINQSQVKPEIGRTFQSILRSMLRQAPNIILIGEIRDKETAEIAVQAALTGHLVFSTLHTNDAPSALTRLVDIGVKPFLVASSVQAIMAQRLVRVLCPKCKEPYSPDPSLLAAAGLKVDDLEGRTVYKPVGCRECRGTGFHNRVAIFELMELGSTIRDLVFKKERVEKLREVARLEGMVTLLEDGIRKFFAGITSLEEVVATTHREDIVY